MKEMVRDQDVERIFLDIAHLNEQHTTRCEKRPELLKGRHRVRKMLQGVNHCNQVVAGSYIGYGTRMEPSKTGKRAQLFKANLAQLVAVKSPVRRSLGKGA